MLDGVDVPPPLAQAVAVARQTYFAEFFKEQDAIIKALMAGQPSRHGAGDWMQFSKSLDSVMTVANVAVDLTQQYADEQAALAARQLAVKSALISASGLFLVTRQIARPLRQLTAMMNQLAAGELGVELSGVERSDEIALMPRATRSFRDGLLRMRELEGDQREAEARAAAEKRVAEECELARQRAAEERIAAERKQAMHCLKRCAVRSRATGEGPHSPAIARRELCDNA